MGTNKIQTGLRIDEDAYAKLRALASAEGRSLNNLTEYILKKYIAAYEAENGAITPAPSQEQ